MANGFGSLYVGNSGMRGAQNGLNVVANNISNADTEGYVRQQVVYEDQTYLYTGKTAAISKINNGLGVGIGDVVHTRDMFLDKAYRAENGRQFFYEASYEAAWEVETMLNQNTGSLGIAFSQSIQDLDDAFNEFANTPGDEVSQNLVAQKASLFLSRAQSVYEGLTNYQTNINNKIQEDVDRINELGKTINELNQKIQKVEAAGVETAKEMRDARDAAIDELSGLASITYKETVDNVVKVQIEGTDFVIGTRFYKIETYTDPGTGYITPYWGVLSDPKRDDYYEVFDLSRIDPSVGTDVGELKALLLARGDVQGTYMDFLDTEYYKGNVDDKYIPAEQIGEISSRKYDNGIANSVMINSEAELDRIVHEMVTKINDLLSPTVAVSDSGEVAGIADKMKELNEVNGTEYSMALSAVIVHDQDSWTHTMSADNLRIFDKQNACVGSDREIPTKELFARAGVERYRTVTVEVPYGDKNGVGIYHYTDAGTGQRERAYPVYETTDGRRAYLVLDENGNSTADEDGNLLYVDGDGKSVSYKGIRGYFTDDNGVIQYAKTDGTNWTGLTESEATTVAADKTETFTAYAYNDEGLARRFNTSTKQWEISRSLDSNTGQWVLDRDCCYTLSALSIEESVMTDPSLIAHLHQNGDIAYDLSQSIYALWNSSDCTLNPSDVTTCSYSGFYTKIVGELATTQSVYKTMSDSLENTRQSIENNRQAVIGVSTDEELQTMIKFQNAYNASSRYINVVNSMIETLINSCGTIR